MQLKDKTKPIIPDRIEIYSGLILCFTIVILGIITRFYIEPQTLLHVFTRDMEFVFLIGLIVCLKSNWSAEGIMQNRGMEEGADWEMTKNDVIKRVVLGEKEKIIRVINYGIVSGRLQIRFDVLTNQRLLRYKKYFGVTEEIQFAGVKSYSYQLSFLTMRLRFETDGGIKQFEIVMRKRLNKEMMPVLDKIMSENSIPKNDSL